MIKIILAISVVVTQVFAATPQILSYQADTANFIIISHTPMSYDTIGVVRHYLDSTVIFDSSVVVSGCKQLVYNPITNKDTLVCNGTFTIGRIQHTDSAHVYTIDSFTTVVWQGSALFSVLDPDADTMRITFDVNIGKDTIAADSIWGVRKVFTGSNQLAHFQFHYTHKNWNGFIPAKVRIMFDDVYYYIKPKVFAGNDTALPMGSTYTLHGAASDSAEGVIAKMEWSIGGNPFVVTTTGDAPLQLPLNDTNITCVFKATDNDNNSSYDTVVVTSGEWYVAWQDSSKSVLDVVFHREVPYFRDAYKHLYRWSTTYFNWFEYPNANVISVTTSDSGVYAATYTTDSMDSICLYKVMDSTFSLIASLPDSVSNTNGVFQIDVDENVSYLSTLNSSWVIKGYRFDPAMTAICTLGNGSSQYMASKAVNNFYYIAYRFYDVWSFKKYNGTWSQFGPNLISVKSGTSGLIMDTDTCYLAVNGGNNSTQVDLYKLIGTTWFKIGTNLYGYASFAGLPIQYYRIHPSFTVVNHVPYAMSRMTCVIKYFDGNWVNVGNSIPSKSGTSIISNENKIYVIDVAKFRIYALR